MQDLTRGARELTTVVAAMRVDFASAHAAMAQQTREERGAFVAAVSSEVHSLLGAFSRERNEMARKGRHDRGAFLKEMRRQVTGLCKDTADDLLGARLAWRGRSPGKSRFVPVKEEAVVVKPLSPPVEKAPKETVTAPEIKTETETFAAAEVKTEIPSVTLMEPVESGGEKETVGAALQTSTVTPSHAEILDEKSAKAATKMKRGGKHNRSAF